MKEVKRKRRNFPSTTTEDGLFVKFLSAFVTVNTEKRMKKILTLCH